MSPRASRRAVVAGLVMLMLTGLGARAWAVTPVPMGPGNYSEDFGDIANWTDNFAAGIGADHYNAITAGTFPDPNQTTVFATGSAGGVQRGIGNIQLLATGTTDDTNAAAFDLYLDFTGVVAGTISLDWAEVTDSTGDLNSTFKLQTNGGSGSTFTDLAGTSVTITNNVSSSGSLTAIALPAGFTNSSGGIVRFYLENGTGGTTGSRPKISIDNVAVTRTCPTISVAMSKTDVTCFGAANGTATASASGGTAPYTYTWTPSGSGGTITGLAPGTYDVTATDANGCTGTGSITIAQPSALALSLAKTDLTCNGAGDGSVTATFSGGTGAYQVRVDGGAYTTQASPFTFSSLAAGSHTVDLQDANGCAASASISLTEPSPVAITTSSLPNGQVGSAYSQSITASGGTAPYSFAPLTTLPSFLTLSSGGAFSGTPTSAGTSSFDVQATDANGCTATITYSLTVDPAPTSTVSVGSATACATPAHPCQTLPVNIARTDATGLRLFHVTFQLSAGLQLCSTPTASITEGAYLNSVNPSTTFLITTNGGGSYTVDGTINGTPCGATAASGNLFNISVAGTGTSGPGTVTITGLTLRDCSNNTLASTIGSAGSVTVDTAPVTVAAIPTPQNVVELSPLTITPSATLTACATGPVTWSVAPALPAGATFDTGTGEIQWTPACGTAGTYGPFTLTATAASGDAGASNAFSIVVAHKVYTIAASAGAGGTISPSGNVGVDCGADQAFTITPDACHTIADVLVDGVSVGAVASYTFTNVTAGHTIAASFTVKTYTIAASAGAGGTISPTGSVTVDCGSDQAFTITPDACHDIADVLVDGVSVGAVASYTFTNVTAGHTIAASFAVKTYTIAASAGTGGAISPSGNVPVDCDANQSFTITPDACHTIADVLVDGVSVGAVASYTFSNVTANHTIAASFTVITYTITASAGAGGGISPTGSVSVNCGSDQAFAIAPDACHTIADVLVDGVSVGAVAGWTFSNVTANHTIAASFVHVPSVVNAPATVTTTQVLIGNPVGADHTGITVHFAGVPGAVTYKVYRAPYGQAPEYDDNGGTDPTPPTSWPPAAPWTLTSVTADGGVDTPPTRDFWYYAVYAVNACDDVSASSPMSGGTLDYHLGDVSDNVTPGHGDDLVDIADISLLGAHYGINLAPNDPFDYLDVGPTTTNFVDGRPQTDNRVDFEDLVMLAINYGQVTTASRTKPPVAADATPATTDQLTIESPQHVQPGDDDVVVTLGASGTGRVQAAAAKLTWDPKVVDLVGWTPGAFLEAQNGMLLSSAKGALDLAILGQGQALTGAGAVATVRFHVVGAGDPAIGIASVDARDTHNAKVTMGTSRIVAQSAPTVTTLQPVAPNPSRGAATLSFSIARRSPVDIRIYAVDGRLVRTLFHGMKEPGVYSVAWDGRDDRGSVVAGGVFFARMTTDHAASTRTLTRMR